MPIHVKPLIGSISLGFAIALFASSAFAADQCVAACNLQQKECIASQAKTVKLACRVDCRANAAQAELGACTRACADQFRADKDSCREQRAVCADPCDLPAVDPTVDGACVQGCGQDLGGCVEGVITVGRNCVSQCKSTPGDGIIACLKDCAIGAAEDGHACGADFGACLETCGVTLSAPPITLPGPPSTLPIP